MPAEKIQFGKTAQRIPVDLYTLENESGMRARFTTYGATLVELVVPDRRGRRANVVLGFDNLSQYLGDHPWFGSTIGRYANRIGQAEMVIDGATYKLSANDGENCLHGGLNGFDKKVWKARTSGASVKFSYLSKHLEEGFPGNLNVEVTYSLSQDSALRIDYEAACDQKTALNLTHHSYFNLAGAGQGNILDHRLTIFAHHFTPTDEKLVPTGKIESVSDTALDFLHEHKIASKIHELYGGFDHNFVLDNQAGKLALAAILREPVSGRVMEVWTTEPGLQVYSGNNLDGSQNGNGGAYGKHYGIALEAQHFPDSVHHHNFPSTFLSPEQTYRQTTIYKFGFDR